MTNTYPSRFSIAVVKPQRSVALIGMVLLHVGLIIALTHGLENRNSPNPTTVSKTWIIDAPPVTPPIIKVAPVIIDSALPSESTKTPVVDPVVTTGDRHDESRIAVTGSDVSSSGGVPSTSTLVRIDPRNPLQQPTYPTQSRRLGEQGKVELAIYVLANGRVGEARVEHSSGFARLDEAALREALRSWRLLPAQVNDASIASWHRIAITFSLKD